MRRAGWWWTEPTGSWPIKYFRKSILNSGNWRWTCLHRGWPPNSSNSTAGDPIYMHWQRMHSSKIGGGRRALPTNLGPGQMNSGTHIHQQLVQDVILTTPLWKAQPWYPNPLEMLVDYPRLIEDSPVATTPIKYIPQLLVWSLRQQYQSQKFSHATYNWQRNIIQEGRILLHLSSWRTKTNKSFDSLFGKWSWCSEQHRNPVSGPIVDVVNSLADVHERGYPCRSWMPTDQRLLLFKRRMMASMWENILWCPACWNKYFTTAHLCQGTVKHGGSVLGHFEVLWFWSHWHTSLTKQWCYLP